MPIILGATTETPEWNRAVLAFLWIYQFAIVGIVELYIFLAISFSGWGGHSAGTAGFFLVMLLLCNIVILVTIPYEAHLFATGNLPTQKYLRIQTVKCAYVAIALFVVIVLYSGVYMSTVGGIMLFWSWLWRLTLLIAPFAGALCYAIVVRRNSIGSMEEASGLLW